MTPDAPPLPFMSVETTDALTRLTFDGTFDVLVSERSGAPPRLVFPAARASRWMLGVFPEKPSWTYEWTTGGRPARSHAANTAIALPRCATRFFSASVTSARVRPYGG